MKGAGDGSNRATGPNGIEDFERLGGGDDKVRGQPVVEPGLGVLVAEVEDLGLSQPAGAGGFNRELQPGVFDRVVGPAEDDPCAVIQSLEGQDLDRGGVGGGGPAFGELGVSCLEGEVIGVEEGGRSGEVEDEGIDPAAVGGDVGEGRSLPGAEGFLVGCDR